MNATAATLTPQQSQAIGTRHVSVALSAGAGCGKTFVLTERFLNYFDPRDPEALGPDELSHLVAITFTDRAAREMRDRIRRKCYERLLAADGADADYWLGLVRSLDSARVSTIHSFCGALLRSHAVEARLDPRFGVLDQSQADTLLAESIDDALRELLSERDETTLDLAVRFGLDTLRAMIARLVNRRERGAFDKWLARSPEEQVAAWTEYHGRVVVPAVLRRIAHSPAAQALVDLVCQHASSNKTMQERCNALREILAAWQAGASEPKDPAAELARLRENARVQGGGGKTAWDSDGIYESVKENAEELRTSIDKHVGHLQFDAAAALPAAVAGRQVLEVAQKVSQRYAAQKEELGVLDFNDLLTRAHGLLTDPAHDEVRRRLASQTRLLLVDEFQDTDPTQVELIEALCGEEVFAGKLFFVGDYKQSIYRFRGADPHVFRQLRERIPAEGQLPLTLNFRSQPAILDFVNWVFARPLGPEYEPLRPSRPQVSPTPAVEFLWAPAEKEADKEGKESLRRREADWIARRLRALIDSKEPLVWDAAAAERGMPQARPAQPGDVALLFRALSDVAYYEEALRKYGLPYYLVGGHAFYAQQEIFDLVNLLRSLASSADSVSLAGVLRSPMFSLADETLYWLAQHRDGLAGGLFANKLTKELDEDQRQRVSFAAKTLLELRQRKDRLPIAELIGEAIARTGYDAALVAEFLGERKLANLRKLIEQSRSFERAGMFTLSDFIAQLSDFVAQQPDEPLAATHPEATDVVRLMTIHQSKGLEFPIVVVPDLDRAGHGRTTPVDFSPELGPLVKMPAALDGTTCLGGYELHAVVAQEEDEAEVDRLFYVATTRAADYLILSAGVQRLNVALGHGMRLLSRRFDLVTGKPCDPTADDPPAPDVRVTITCPELDYVPDAGQPKHSPGEAVSRALQLAAAGDVHVPPLIDPIPPDRAARRQYSFSSLHGTLHKPRPMPDPHATDETAQAELQIDPLGLGTLVHVVLAAVDFTQPQDIAALVRRHADRHLEAAQGEVDEAVAMLERFLASDRASQLAKARDTFVELEFLLAWPPDAAQAGGVYLGGFIDRLWQDGDGRWHILDFKTNKVAKSNVAKTAEPYEMQLLVYALAAEQVLGVAPASLTLHFLRTGQEHTFRWDDAARKRVRKLVDAAIADAATS